MYFGKNIDEYIINKYKIGELKKYLVYEML